MVTKLQVGGLYKLVSGPCNVDPCLSDPTGLFTYNASDPWTTCGDMRNGDMFLYLGPWQPAKRTGSGPWEAVLTKDAVKLAQPRSLAKCVVERLV